METRGTISLVFSLSLSVYIINNSEFDRSNEAERAQAANPSAPAQQSNCFDRLSEAKEASARLPSRLKQQIRAPQLSRTSSRSHFERLRNDEVGLSGQLERPNA